jgi:prepilin-type processing-associated H-X9-DG protein
MKRAFTIFVFALLCAPSLPAESLQVRTLLNLTYKTGAELSDYEKERCKLDVYLPPAQQSFATLIWFHGGGLKAGNKNGADTQKIARSLAASGLTVVVPNYRLSPNVKFPAYIEDSAAAVAWTKAHITEHGGSANRLFVGGHSAGGYLALMLGMDEHYLKDCGMKTTDICGYIPVSGQTMTHYSIRAERGIGKYNVTADEAAPVRFARADTPPFLVLYADRDMEARAEENAYFVALMKGAKNKNVTGLLVTDRTHGSIASKIAEDGDPARKAILEFMARQCSGK